MSYKGKEEFNAQTFFIANMSAEHPSHHPHGGTNQSSSATTPIYHPPLHITRYPKRPSNSPPKLSHPLSTRSPPTPAAQAATTTKTCPPPSPQTNPSCLHHHNHSTPLTPPPSAPSPPTSSQTAATAAAAAADATPPPPTTTPMVRTATARLRIVRRQ